MNLLTINGSPRGKSSNTNKLIEYFTKEITPASVKTLHLKEFYDKNDFGFVIEEFKNYEVVLIGFPLYADWTPGFVKLFFEAMGENIQPFKDKQFLYLTQCGFPESHHCRFVEKYCERFTKRIGGKYMGTIVRGGSEGARLIPEKFFKDSKKLAQLGKIFEAEKRLDKNLLKSIAKPEKLTKAGLTRMRLMLKTPFSNLYWNSQLKKNGVFEKRFDKPYS